MRTEPNKARIGFIVDDQEAQAALKSTRKPPARKAGGQSIAAI
jgi:hypothetical protein